MANVVGNLIVNLTAEIAGFESDMGRAQRLVDKQRKQFERDLGKIGAQVAAIAVTAAVGMTALVKSSINAADDMGKLAQKLGIAVPRLSELAFAAKMSNVELGQLSFGIGNFSKYIASAAGGAERQANAFAAMGIALRDTNGNLRGTEEILADVAEQFSKYEDGAAKTALAQVLFGRSGNQLLPFLNEGKKGLEDLAAQANTLGMVWSTETTVQADAFNDKLEILKSGFQGFVNQVAAEVLPALNNLADIFVDNATKSGQVTGSAELFAGVLKKVIYAAIATKETIEILTNVILGLVYNAMTAFGALGRQAEITGDMIKGAMLGLPGIIYNYGDAVEATAANISQTSAEFSTNFATAAAGVENSLNDILQAYNALFATQEGIDAATLKKWQNEEEGAKKVKAPILAAAAANDKLAKALEAVRQRMLQAAAARVAYTKGLEELRAEMAGPLAQAALELNRALDENQNAFFEGIATQEEAIEMQRLLHEQYALTTKAIKAQIPANEQLIKDMRFELDLLKLSDKERDEAIALRRLDADATEAQIEQVKKLNAELNREMETMRDKAQFQSAVDGFASIFAEGVLTGFENSEEAVLDFIKQLAKDVMETWIKQNITLPLTTGEQPANGLSTGQNAMIAGSVALLSAYLANRDSEHAGRNQGALSGAMAGAQLGLMSANPWGAVIGALIGAIAGGALGSQGDTNPRISTIGSNVHGNVPGSGDSRNWRIGDPIGGLFGIRHWSSRGSNRQDSTNYDNDRQNFETAFGTSAFANQNDITDADRAEFIRGLREFDAQIAALLNHGQLAAVSEQLRTFNSDATDLESILEDRLVHILGGLPDSIGTVVQSFDTLQARIQALGDALDIQQILEEGLSIFRSFDALAPVMVRLNDGVQPLLEQFQQLTVLNSHYTDAIAFSGETIRRSASSLFTFADALADAVGSFERADELWANFFEAFYTEEERARRSVSVRRTTAESEVRDVLGRQVDTEGLPTLEAFRQMFEEVLPTLSAASLAEWLEAADALGLYNDAVEHNAELLARARQAVAEYNSFLDEMDDALLEFEGSEFTNQLRAIDRQMQVNIRRANDLARAAGLQGAREQDLAMIHRLAAEQAAAAMRELEGAARDLIAELYGTELDQLNEQIAAFEASLQSSGQIVDQITAANESRYAEELAAIEQIAAYLDSLLLSNLSTLTPAERLGESQSQFMELLARAQGGDVDALAQLSQAANAYLTEARSYFADSAQYDQIFAAVQAMLQGVVAAGTRQPPPTDTSGTREPVQISPTAELIALYQQRDEALAAAEAERRRLMAEDLARYLRDMAAFTGESLSELSERLGFDIGELVTDLGVDLEDITAASIQNLGNIANLLGVELTDLAGNLDVALGDLASAQSLLNDALEGVIGELPVDIQAQLGPLLTAIEAAADTREANDALAAMEAYINTLPEDFRTQLAPYFENVDIPDVLEEIDYLENIDVGVDDVEGAITVVRERIETQTEEVHGGRDDNNTGHNNTRQRLDDVHQKLVDIAGFLETISTRTNGL